MDMLSWSPEIGSIGKFPDEVILLASSNPKKPAGRKKFRETRHPVYRGVRQRKFDKWVCEVREPNKKSRIWLGTFPTAEMAARANDVAVIALRGGAACLNFSDSLWRLPVPVSTGARDIQMAAAEAAELFRPFEGEQCYESVVPEDDDVALFRPFEREQGDEMVVPEDYEVALLGPFEVEQSDEMVVPDDDNVAPQCQSFIYNVDDNDEVYPGYIADMANGMMLPPPSQDLYDMEFDADQWATLCGLS